MNDVAPKLGIRHHRHMNTNIDQNSTVKLRRQSLQRGHLTYERDQHVNHFRGNNQDSNV